MQNLSQEQFNDEMFDAYQHLINFDYKRVFSITRPWANSFPDFRSCLEEKEGVLICDLDDKAWILRGKFQTAKDRQEDFYMKHYEFATQES